MKLLWILLLLGLLGCNKQERFVKVAEESLPKSVVIYVSGITEMTFLQVTDEGFSIVTATVPVTVTGAGVFVSPNNHVLTCDHLFELDKITGITVCDYNDTCTAGEVLEKRASLDLALVHTFFDAPTNYIRLADPRKLRIGQETIAIGNPLGFPFSVSHGIVSALNRDNLGVNNMTQSDTFLNPGNSGGPLINLNGELVGINSCIVPPVNANIFTGLGFSVQTGEIIRFLTDVRNHFDNLGDGFPKYDHSYWEVFKYLMGFRSGYESSN